MKTKLLTLVSAIALLFAGCKGDQGDPGAQGPEGNANVVGTQFAVTDASWSDNNGDYTVDLTVPALTSDIASGGAVETFLSQDGGTTWIALPFTTVASNSENAFWNYAYSTGSVTVALLWNGADNGSPNAFYNVNTLDINVVCIAPATMKKYPNTNWKDYNVVKSILQLQNNSSK